MNDKYRQIVLDYFNGDELATDVWMNKYQLKTEDGFFEKTPDEMHRRLAKHFYDAQFINPPNDKEDIELSDYGKLRNNILSEDEIYELFKNFNYIVPQGSVMSQLGNTSSVGSLSNCFVIGQPEDSYGGICKKDEEMAQLMKRRGGVGLDLSTIRPEKTRVKNAAITSTGMPSFMERYSNTTREVAQDGRRGALMLSTSIRHPDSLGFITAKQDRSKVTGANISVMITNDFMEAVRNDDDYILRFPVDLPQEACDMAQMDQEEYNVLVERETKDGGKHYFKRIKARDYWNTIIHCAWDSAEPGIIFIDNHWDYSPDGVYPQYRGITTNPCGEIFMQPFDACRLIAKNLFSFVKNPFNVNAEIDYGKLYQISYEQQYLGDILVDIELGYIKNIINKIKSDPEDETTKRTELELWEKIYDVASSGRRTGNGITSLGDMLAALNVKYDSNESFKIIDSVYYTIMKAELDATIDMSILKGSFKGWDPNIEKSGNRWYNFVQQIYPEQFARMQKYGRRNISFSTVAPTGSVSIMTQTTSGIEPLFSPYYMRRKKINPNDKGVRVDFTDQNGDNWQEYPVMHPKFRNWAIMHIEDMISGISRDEQVMRMSSEEVQKLFEVSPWYQSIANDIDWEKRVELQGIIQKYVTHSISSTINLPNDVTEEDVAKIYEKAWDAGLKGVTVYRDGCRTGVLVSNDAKDTERTFGDVDAPKRPKRLPCKVIRFQNKYEKWIAFVGLLNGRPYEIFTGPSDMFKVPNNIDDGIIIKTKIDGNKSYDFEYDCEEGKCIVEGLSKAFHKEYWNYARLISSMLRHGMPIYYVTETIENMSFTEDTINTWKSGVVRALKKYIKDGTKINGTCYDCGSDRVIFEEGCVRCIDCGSSKCG